MTLTRAQRRGMIEAEAWIVAHPIGFARVDKLTWLQAQQAAPWPVPGVTADSEREYRLAFAEELRPRWCLGPGERRSGKSGQKKRNSERRAEGFVRHLFWLTGDEDAALRIAASVADLPLARTIGKAVKLFAEFEKRKKALDNNHK